MVDMEGYTQYRLLHSYPSLTVTTNLPRGDREQEEEISHPKEGKVKVRCNRE